MSLGYPLFVISLVCIGAITSIVTGVAAYLVSKKFKLAKAVLAVAGTFFLVIVGFPWLMGTLDDVKHGAWVTFEAAELVGTWKATYEEVGPQWISGVETFTLRADGTYEQVFKDKNGYAYTSPRYKWRLENRQVIHLEHGRFYPEGIDWAEDLEKGEAVIISYDWRGKKIELDGTEILLYARPDSDAPGGVILEHLPVGDPDTPDYVRFYRVATPVPESTDTP